MLLSLLLLLLPLLLLPLLLPLPPLLLVTHLASLRLVRTAERAEAATAWRLWTHSVFEGTCAEIAEHALGTIGDARLKTAAKALFAACVDARARARRARFDAWRDAWATERAATDAVAAAARVAEAAKCRRALCRWVAYASWHVGLLRRGDALSLARAAAARRLARAFEHAAATVPARRAFARWVGRTRAAAAAAARRRVALREVGIYLANAAARGARRNLREVVRRWAGAARHAALTEAALRRALALAAHASARQAVRAWQRHLDADTVRAVARRAGAHRVAGTLQRLQRRAEKRALAALADACIARAARNRAAAAVAAAAERVATARTRRAYLLWLATARAQAAAEGVAAIAEAKVRSLVAAFSRAASRAARRAIVRWRECGLRERYARSVGDGVRRALGTMMLRRAFADAGLRLALARWAANAREETARLALETAAAYHLAVTFERWRFQTNRVLEAEVVRRALVLRVGEIRRQRLRIRGAEGVDRRARFAPPPPVAAREGSSPGDGTGSSGAATRRPAGVEGILVVGDEDGSTTSELTQSPWPAGPAAGGTGTGRAADDWTSAGV